MKLSFRDLKQQKFTIDAEPTDTIGQVKEKIAAEKGWEATSQKLIYSGKILADANTVESYKIEEKGFIVCMVSKPKTAAASKPAAPPATPAVSTSTPAQPPAPQQSSTSTTASNPPATPTPQQPPSAAAPAPAAAAPATATTEGGGFNDPSAMLVGSRNEATIQQMEAMGFARPEIERALRAAFFNPDRAIEYILNGIPEDVQAEQRAAQQQQQQPQQQQQQQQRSAQQPAATSPSPAPARTTTQATTGGAAAAPAAAQTAEGDEPINLFEAAAQAGQGGRVGTGARSAGAGAGQPGAGGQVNMDFLRNSPHFQHLRQLVQQQPAMLEPILQQVAEGNPQLAQMIGQNQEQFLQLLSEDLAGGEGGGIPPGAIAVTQEEHAAIERLIGLGFSRDRVIQAYFACDKNEELAANFLFEQPEDDDV